MREWLGASLSEGRSTFNILSLAPGFGPGFDHWAANMAQRCKPFEKASQCRTPSVWTLTLPQASFSFPLMWPSSSMRRKRLGHIFAKVAEFPEGGVESGVHPDPQSLALASLFGLLIRPETRESTSLRRSLSSLRVASDQVYILTSSSISSA